MNVKCFYQNTDKNVSIRIRKDERWTTFFECCKQPVPSNALEDAAARSIRTARKPCRSQSRLCRLCDVQRDVVITSLRHYERNCRALINVFTKYKKRNIASGNTRVVVENKVALFMGHGVEQVALPTHCNLTSRHSFWAFNYTRPIMRQTQTTIQQFRTATSAVVLRKMGKMFEWIEQDQPRTQPLI